MARTEAAPTVPAAARQTKRRNRAALIFERDKKNGEKDAPLPVSTNKKRSL